MYRLGCILGLMAPLRNDRLAGAWHCHIAMADDDVDGDVMADLRFQTLTVVIKLLVKHKIITRKKDNDKNKDTTNKTKKLLIKI